MTTVAVPSSDWTLERLRTFLRDSGVNCTGKKADLFKRALQIFQQSTLDAKIKSSVPDLDIGTAVPSFKDLPEAGWSTTGFPDVRLPSVRQYLDSKVNNGIICSTRIDLCVVCFQEELLHWAAFVPEWSCL